jgi:hypothetical protein
MPLAMSPEVKQMIAGHGGLDQVGPSQLLETIIGNQRRDPRSDGRSDRQNMNDPIAQFAPGYMTLLDDQNWTALLRVRECRVISAQLPPTLPRTLIETADTTATVVSRRTPRRTNPCTTRWRQRQRHFARSQESLLGSDKSVYLRVRMSGSEILAQERKGT